MRISLTPLVVGLIFTTPLSGQQPDQSPAVDATRVTIRKTLQLPLNVPADPPWVAPGPTRLGVLTFVPAERNGEMIRVVVPVGELAARAARAVSTAQHRHSERKARAEVIRALQDFQVQRPPE